MSEDKRVVTGIRCTWWDSISKVSSKNGIPVCPHCGSPLFEFESQEVWDEAVLEYDENSHPGYKKMVDWGRGLCFPNYQVLEQKYKSENSLP